jgi:hypothetical protein
MEDVRQSGGRFFREMLRDDPKDTPVIFTPLAVKVYIQLCDAR